MPVSTPIEKAKDVAAITSVIEGMANCFDRGDYESLAHLYSDHFEIDYSSIFGGSVLKKTREQQLACWAEFLPGFDLVRHSLSDFKIRIEEGVANASCSVLGQFYLGEKVWEVTGHYQLRLHKRSNHWRVFQHSFFLHSENGNGDLLQIAKSRAKSHPPGFVKRRRAQAAVIKFLKALENKDMEALASVWADKAIKDMPYSPDGFPDVIEGKANLIEHYSSWPENAGEADFTSHLRFYPMVSPEWVFAEFNGEVEILTTGREYNQIYGGLFHVPDGKIQYFREYFNPELFKFAYALDDHFRRQAFLGKND
ncbi:putative PhzA/B-like protein [Pseudovibrio axinellae]|uniref:Putative PhzA/B-like protein n=1 Tax=Pseudovibrio axinellae TaxID=989403 RepID=A0A165T3N1_9HYPH|nr:nuclear transport factor 2 family protein [Pseudovibrio axinellae]KZL05382.1 putative PhzA/B-like protein [Pseudovibrio axinellae]SER37308.1 Ketosteroid isomerase-related protein [Pseudovibrio axinellae]